MVGAGRARRSVGPLGLQSGWRRSRCVAWSLGSPVEAHVGRNRRRRRATQAPRRDRDRVAAAHAGAGQRSQDGTGRGREREPLRSALRRSWRCFPGALHVAPARGARVGRPPGDLSAAAAARRERSAASITRGRAETAAAAPRAPAPTRPTAVAGRGRPGPTRPAGPGQPQKDHHEAVVRGVKPAAPSQVEERWAARRPATARRRRRRDQRGARVGRSTSARRPAAA